MIFDTNETTVFFECYIDYEHYECLKNKSFTLLCEILKNLPLENKCSETTTLILSGDHYHKTTTFSDTKNIEPNDIPMIKTIKPCLFGKEYPRGDIPYELDGSVLTIRIPIVKSNFSKLNGYIGEINTYLDTHLKGSSKKIKLYAGEPRNASLTNKILEKIVTEFPKGEYTLTLDRKCEEAKTVSLPGNSGCTSSALIKEMKAANGLILKELKRGDYFSLGQISKRNKTGLTLISNDVQNFTAMLKFCADQEVHPSSPAPNIVIPGLY
ncbi:MAG: hypothetical protein GY941_22595 [Planctomycetes bacterium]|nr:hypothetical protein [Planctomycetota bacterium]